jgi:c(7)-type cytochrome triheme protein
MIPKKRLWKTSQPSVSMGILTVATILLVGIVSCYHSLKGTPKLITNIPGAAGAAKPPPPEAAPTPFDALHPAIRFSHKIHAPQIECVGCHATVKEGVRAGTPKLSLCLDCHEEMQSTKPENQAEEKKLAIYAAGKSEIPWPRVGFLDPGTKFSHKVHVVEGELDCKDCHGDIAQADALPKKLPYPYNHTLCGQCHDTSQAANNCKTCHPR